MKNKSLIRRRQKGFTIAEILIVVGMIALLATVLFVGITAAFKSGQSDISNLWINNTAKNALNLYRVHVKKYPSTSQGLKALVEKPNDVDARLWKGPYLEELPTDPWGNPYRYMYPGRKNVGGYDLWSAGPSGKDGAEDNIVNWKTSK